MRVENIDKRIQTAYQNEPQSMNRMNPAQTEKYVPENVQDLPEDVDQERVSAIRSALASGTYKIDARAVAAKITNWVVDVSA